MRAIGIFGECPGGLPQTIPAREQFHSPWGGTRDSRGQFLQVAGQLGRGEGAPTVLSEPCARQWRGPARERRRGARARTAERPGPSRRRPAPREGAERTHPIGATSRLTTQSY